MGSYDSSQERALYYQEIILPYAEKAERKAQEIMSSLNLRVPKIYELISNKGIKNKLKRFFWKHLEASLS